MRYLPTIAVVVGLCATGGGCGLDPEAVVQSQEPITDGRACAEHPEVGLFRLGRLVCTATLVGRRTALTAAHCLGAAGPATLVLEGKSYPVEKTLQHPEWDSKSLANDLAVVRLVGDPGVAPAAVVTRAPTQGMDLRLIGFGVTDEAAQDAFIKREADNRLAELLSTRFTVSGSGAGHGNICHGDSGGPALVEVAGVAVLVGVASAGIPPCGTVAYFSRVDAYVAWLRESSEGDLELAPDGPAGEEFISIAVAAESGLEPLSGGEGGCTLGDGSRTGPLGATLLLMSLVAALWLARRG